MQAQQITVYSLEEFAREFLTKEQIVALGEVLDKRHTWGDTDLVCIGKDLLIEDLQRAGVEVPVYLVDQVSGDDLFEITGSTNDFWLGDILADSCPPFPEDEEMAKRDAARIIAAMQWIASG